MRLAGLQRQCAVQNKVEGTRCGIDAQPKRQDVSGHRRRGQAETRRLAIELGASLDRPGTSKCPGRHSGIEIAQYPVTTGLLIDELNGAAADGQFFENDRAGGNAWLAAAQPVQRTVR